MSGEIVVVPFPFTDLTSSKVRPALVVVSFTRGDMLLCQITARKLVTHKPSNSSNPISGSTLARQSFVLPHRLVTANELCVRRAIAKVRALKLHEIRQRICSVIQKG